MDTLFLAYLKKNKLEFDPTLLKTDNLGVIDTSPTSATDLEKSITLTGQNDYDALVVEVIGKEVKNNKHYSTISFLWLYDNTNSGKKSINIVSSTWNSKINNEGKKTTYAGTTKYGIYVNNYESNPNGSLTLKFYYRSSSTYSYNFDNDYIVKVYGIKLFDL